MDPHAAHTFQRPDDVEKRIFGATDEEKALRTKDTNVAECVDLLCTILNQILTSTAGSGVPIGLNVESVSIYREEIDAAHAMFRRMQVIMLDAAGRPWSVRWCVGSTALALPLFSFFLKKRNVMKRKRGSIGLRIELQN